MKDENKTIELPDYIYWHWIGEEKEFLDPIADIEYLCKIEAVLYTLRKERNENKIDNKYLEEVYMDMEDYEREKIRQSILKDAMVRKIKIDRKKIKKEKEKKQKEYFEYQKKIKEDRKNRDITKKIKALWGEELLDEPNIKIKRTFTITNIISENVKNTTFYSNTMALNYIRRNNFFKFKIGQEFLCEIVEGNIGWIGKDAETERVRYFSKNPETGKFFYLDIIDLVQMELKCSFVYAFLKVMELLKIKTEEEEWKKIQTEKYRNNIKITDNASYNFKISYPNLYKLIGKQIKVLEKLNAIGFYNIRTLMERVGEDAIFFSSYQYVADFLDVSKSSVAKAVNLFATLGLINIINENKIPPHLLDRAKKEAKDKGWKNLVTYFTIPYYSTKVLRDAEEIAKQLRENGITVRNISIKTLEEAFGEEMVQKVFPNTKENTEKIMEIKNMKKQYWEQIEEKVKEMTV